MSEIATRENSVFAGLEQAANLPDGSLSLVGLDLEGHQLSFEQWESIGRGLGHVHRWSAFALGDWLLWGVGSFGDDAYAATEGATPDRYDVAARVTGLAADTLRNYMSLSARIAKSRRRVELPALTHEPVGKLSPDEQNEWLQKAVDNAWTREDLRAAINGPRQSTGGGGGALGRRDRIMVAAEHVAWCAHKAAELAEPYEDGYLIPSHVWEPLVAALNEGEEA